MTFQVVRVPLLALGLFLLVLAAVEDLRARIISNGLVISIAFTGLLLGAATHANMLWINIVAAVLVLVVFGAIAHFGTLGGGDIKLMAAVTLLVPPAQIAGLLLAIALAGGIVSAIYLLLHRVLKPRRRARGPRSRNVFTCWWLHERARIMHSRTVPYALAISGGSIPYIIAEWHRCWSATSCSL
jgi:prepilin peptidase CpaA